jgi:hypothetical protein
MEKRFLLGRTASDFVLQKNVFAYLFSFCLNLFSVFSLTSSIFLSTTVFPTINYCILFNLGSWSLTFLFIFVHFKQNLSNWHLQHTLRRRSGEIEFFAHLVQMFFSFKQNCFFSLLHPIVQTHWTDVRGRCGFCQI